MAKPAATSAANAAVDVMVDATVDVAAAIAVRDVTAETSLLRRHRWDVIAESSTLTSRISPFMWAILV